jgi:2-succinyl-5-enolpyruvyl-6-hydroxy-3-cyclohexene-1-carboxylate synthase
VHRSNRNYAFVVPFVDALAGLGLRSAVIAPGSRSTPLALALADHPEIEDYSFHDERSGAFFALGAAKTSGVPVAVVTTSGTAAAELLPAAVEARNGRVPLLLLTADRPPELRHVGAAQAIDQVKLYGDTVKWFHEVGVPEPSPEFLRTAPALAVRAWADAAEAPAGPVHLNFSFREPLVPVEVPGEVPEMEMIPPPPRYFPGRLYPDEASVAELAALVEGKRTLIVAGAQDDAALPPAVAGLAGAAGFPVVTDALSQLRAGTHDLANVIATGHAIAASGWMADNPPEVVIRTGASPTSKPLARWLADHPEIPQVVIDPAGWRDPDAAASTVLRANPALTATALTKAIAATAPSDWMRTWREADDAAAAALATSTASWEFPSEPGVVEALAAALPAGSLLWVASSMPVRDIDAFLPRIDRPLRIAANRGANGIDGFLSSGFGSAAVVAAPTYLLAGDLAVLHDLTALAAAARLQIPATVIAVNNDGGGIFSFLPQVEYPEHFERHFGTPHGLDLAAASRALGVEAHQVADRQFLVDALRETTASPRLLEIHTDRASNVEIHRNAQQAANKALLGAGE